MRLLPAAPRLHCSEKLSRGVPRTTSHASLPQYDWGDSVFLGDCAHATSPQLGQGANLALVDAWKLSQAMGRHCSADAAGPAVPAQATAASVRAALGAYTAERRWRLWFYQLNSRLLTPVFQSNSRAVGALRDAAFGPMCGWRPTQLQMLTTMIGAQDNLVPWSTIPREEFMGFLEGVEEDALFR